MRDTPGKHDGQQNLQTLTGPRNKRCTATNSILKDHRRRKANLEHKRTEAKHTKQGKQTLNPKKLMGDTATPELTQREDIKH